MKISYTYEILHSNKKDKDFYVMRICLIDTNGNVACKSQPILWLTKEQYEKLSSK